MLGRRAHGRPTFPRPPPACVLAVVVLLASVGRMMGQAEGEAQSVAQVLQDLLARYGDNSTITVPQLRSLLAVLSEGHSDGNGSDAAESAPASPPRTNSSKVPVQSASQNRRWDETSGPAVGQRSQTGRGFMAP